MTRVMFEWVILHTFTTALLAAAVWWAGRRLRLSPGARHALWLLVLVKLLTPPVMYWPWSLPMIRWTNPAPPAPAAAIALPASPSATEAPETSDVAIFSAADAPAPEPPALVVTQDEPPPPAPSPVVAEPPTPWWSRCLPVLPWLWLGGAGVALVVQLIRIERLQLRLRRGRPAGAWLTALVHDAAARLRVRPPRVLVLPGARSPMVWSMGAPLLLWPEGLERRLPPEGRRAVVLHELAHLRRRDHWVGWLLLVGGCVWWWHPLFAFIRRRLTAEAELACDAWVVGAAPETRRAYAEALIEVSQRPSAAVAPALGAAAGRRDLERRVIMIMRGSQASRLSTLAALAVGFLGLLALPAWSLGEGASTPPTVAPATIDAPNPPDAGDASILPPLVSPAHGDVRYTPSATLPGRTDYVPVTIYRAVTTYQPVTRYQLHRTGDPLTDAGPATDRDKKLQELEARIKELVKELEDLRGAKDGKPNTDDPYRRAVTAEPAPVYLRHVLTAPAPASGVEEITLSRVAYKLPTGKAEAVAAFLREQIKASVLETKADGDNLVVTTTPETQHVIGQFIGLIQGKAPARTGVGEKPASRIVPRDIAPGYVPPGFPEPDAPRPEITVPSPVKSASPDTLPSPRAEPLPPVDPTAPPAPAVPEVPLQRTKPADPTGPPPPAVAPPPAPRPPAPEQPGPVSTP
jgi:beta-lactamase regulating signal transducer with metallopeptidase domain